MFSKFLKTKMFLLIGALIFTLAGIAFPGYSQFITRTAKDSVVDAATKTITWTSTPNNLTGIQLSVTKVSGTPSAYALLEVRVDTIISGQWIQEKQLDTFFITNTASQIHVWKVDPQYYNGARIKIVSTGTQKIYIWSAYLRR